MTRIIITHRVEDIAKWKSFDGDRSTNMAAFAKDVFSFVEPQGSNSVAVSMTVTDMDGFTAFLQSETCDAIMRKHGVIKPVTMLTHT